MATATTQRVLRPGVVIANKYRVDKAIARGGFSIIYRGTHIEMERPVALKLLALDDEIKPSWLERFTREARLASQLTHPNTVTIFDYGQDPRGFLYIVMEWVEGASLYHHLKDHGALSHLEVAQVTVQILQSLDEAHRRGFLHRDLKPSNIMLTRDYEGHEIIKVLDFGIAKNLEDKAENSTQITHQGAFIGTPRYASPEQLDGKKLTPAADIYSLGLLMWEALVGDPAVPSIQYGDCVKMHLGKKPWQLPAAVQCPPGLAAIVHKALAKPIDERYQSCRQMHTDLAAWLESKEARNESSQEFLAGATVAGGFGGLGLGAASEVDEDELFAGLSEDSDDPESPLALHGPGGSTTGWSPRDERASAADDDTFERELLELANGGSDDQASASDTRAEEPPAPRQAPPTPAPPSRPRPSVDHAPQSRSRSYGTSMDETKKATLIVAALAGALVLGAGLYYAVSGADTPDEVAAASGGAAPQPAADAGAPDLDELDDGTPTYSADTIWAAIRESGWTRIGHVDSLDFSGVSQQSARFRKQGKTVTVTIYATKSYRDAARYLHTVEAPARAVRFGKTTVQVAPGNRGTSTRGVYALMSTLFELKSIARDQVEKK